MTTQSEKYTVRIITAVATLILIATFIMNGVEKDDAWLYIFAMFCILSIPFATYLYKNKE